VTDRQNESLFSRKNRSLPSPLIWPQFLGPLDPIPDVNITAFLGIISKQLGTILNYMVVRPRSHVRIVQRHHNPADPEALIYPITARNQTTVDSEAISGMLDKFNLTEQQFRDAYNAHYNLTAAIPTVAAAATSKARRVPKIPKA
jgi:hypothetical protein